MNNALDAGETLAVAPGGIAEIFWGYPRPGCKPDDEYALIKARKGFVRMAMRHGLPLVPVYVFGNTKIYKRVQLPSAVEVCRFTRALRMCTQTRHAGPMRVPGTSGLVRKCPPTMQYSPTCTLISGNPPTQALSNMLHVSLVAFWGRLGSLVPFQVPLTYAIGNAIDTGRPNLNPTEAQVDALHALFCAELKRIFDDHKGGYGWGHKELVLV